MSHQEQGSNRDLGSPLRSDVQDTLPDSATQNLDTKRRRFVKGAAIIAPAIFTLPSGASANAFGSFAMCVRNTEDKPELQHTKREDRWARKKVGGFYIAKVKEDATSGEKDYFSYADQDVDLNNVHVLVGYGSNYYIDEGNRRWERSFDGYYRCDRFPGKFKQIKSTSRLTLAYVSESGEMMGINPKNAKYGGGKAVTVSCWISLLPYKTHSRYGT